MFFIVVATQIFKANHSFLVAGPKVLVADRTPQPVHGAFGSCCQLHVSGVVEEWSGWQEWSGWSGWQELCE